MKGVVYHYIRKPFVEFPNLNFLHADDFKKQLDYFENQFGIATAQEFIAATKDEKSLQKHMGKAVLTFDDGLKDHYQYVFPELQRRNLTAFFYVSTGPLNENQLLAVHRLHILLAKYGGETIYNVMMEKIDDAILNTEDVDRFKNQTYQSQNNDWHTTEVKKYFNYYIHYNKRDAVLDELMAEFFPGESSFSRDFYLNKDEIKEMAAAGNIFGSHTINHYLLSKCDEATQEKEILESIQHIEKILPATCARTFCYPYGGAASYNDATLKILEASNVEFAFSFGEQEIDAANILTQRMLLPRFDCNYFPFGKAWRPQANKIEQQ